MFLFQQLLKIEFFRILLMIIVTTQLKLDVLHPSNFFMIKPAFHGESIKQGKDWIKKKNDTRGKGTQRGF